MWCRGLRSRWPRDAQIARASAIGRLLVSALDMQGVRPLRGTDPFIRDPIIAVWVLLAGLAALKTVMVGGVRIVRWLSW